MEHILEKSFINSQLGIKLNSYIDDQCYVWFQAKQVAQILGYKKTEDAIKRHVSETNKIKKVHPRETRGCTFTYYINEPGFYELVFRSRLPAAKMFRQWVFSEVLPSISPPSLLTTVCFCLLFGQLKHTHGFHCLTFTLINSKYLQ